MEGDDGKPKYEMLCDSKHLNAVEEALVKNGYGSITLIFFC